MRWRGALRPQPPSCVALRTLGAVRAAWEAAREHCDGCIGEDTLWTREAAPCLPITCLHCRLQRTLGFREHQEVARGWCGNSMIFWRLAL